MIRLITLQPKMKELIEDDEILTTIYPEDDKRREKKIDKILCLLIPCPRFGGGLGRRCGTLATSNFSVSDNTKMR